MSSFHDSDKTTEGIEKIGFAALGQMIEAKDLLILFGSLISLLLLTLIGVVGYWGSQTDRRIDNVEKDQQEDRLQIELIKERCRFRRSTDKVML